MRVFGKASDFYRLRVIKVREEAAPELDWHDDILIKAPPTEKLGLEEWFVLQAVSVDTERAYALKRFEVAEKAMRYREKAEELLKELTKQAFEAKFAEVDFAKLS